MTKVRATFTVLEGKMAKSQDARMVVVIGAMWLLLPLVATLVCNVIIVHTNSGCTVVPI